MNALSISSIHLAVIRFVGVIFQFLIIIYLTRYLSIEDMGRYAVMYALLSLTRYLGSLGTDQVAIRRISVAIESNSEQEIAIVSGSTIVVALIVGAIISILTFFILLLLFNDVFNNYRIVSICLSIPAFSVIGIFSAQIRGFGFNLAAQVPEAILLHFFLSLSIVTLAIADSLDSTTLFLSLFVSSWSVAGIYLFLRLRITFKLDFKAKLSDYAMLLKEGLVVFQAMVFTVLGLRTPIFLAGALIGSAATAILEVAYRFGYAPSLISTSVGATFSPRMAVISYKRNGKDLIKIFLMGSAIAGIPSILWLLALVFWGRSMVELILPSSYSDVFYPLVIITLATCINAILGIASTWLLMSGNASVVRWFSFMQFITICLGGALFLETFGVIGVAWVIVFGALVRDGGMFVYVCLFQGRVGIKENG